MPIQDLELTNARIIKYLKGQANIYNSFKKMQTTCRQIKGYRDADTPCPRWGHHIVALPDSLLIFGGYQNSNYYNDLWKFDIDTLQFTSIPQTGQIPPPCSNFSMNYDSYRNKLILFGGGSLNKEKLNSVYQLNLDTFQWKQITFDFQDLMPWQRAYHCAEIIGKYLIVFGGEFFSQFNDLWVFDTVTCKWRQIFLAADSIIPQPRKFASSFVWKQKMYIIGGCRTKYECIQDTYCIDLSSLVEEDQIEGLKWEKLKLMNEDLLRRWGHACVIKDDKAYVFGGRIGTKDLQNLVEINLFTNECQEIIINGTLPRGRRKPGLCLRNNTIFCLSGFDGSYVKDFVYMPLMPRPHLYQRIIKKNDYLQRLKQQLHHYKLPDFIINLDKDVFEISEQAYLKCIDYITTNVTTPLRIKQNQLCVCADQFSQKSLYFKHFIQRERNELQIYRPMAISEEDYNILIEIFLLYMQLGKVLLLKDRTSLQTHKYLNYLLELAQYYCLQPLEDIIHRYQFEQFQKKLYSQRCTLQQIVEYVFGIKQRNQKHGEYACYFTLMKLIDNPEVNSLPELIYLIEMGVGLRQKTWVFQMLNKYSFELMQKMLHKEEGKKEDRQPLTNIGPVVKNGIKRVSGNQRQRISWL